VRPWKTKQSSGGKPAFLTPSLWKYLNNCDLESLSTLSTQATANSSWSGRGLAPALQLKTKNSELKIPDSKFHIPDSKFKTQNSKLKT
jgi:hypothetical protein